MIIATYTYPSDSMSEVESAVFSELLRQDISAVLRVRHIKILPGQELSVSVVDKNKQFPHCELIIKKLAADLLRSHAYKVAVKRALASAQP